VLAADGDDLERRLGERLKSEGVEGRLEPVAPNLEDVFVAATRKTQEDKAQGSKAKEGAS
jgi:ABC-2 type transport system ATP-binding protein